MASNFYGCLEPPPSFTFLSFAFPFPPSFPLAIPLLIFVHFFFLLRGIRSLYICCHLAFRFCNVIFELTILLVFSRSIIGEVVGRNGVLIIVINLGWRVFLIIISWG